MEAVAADAVEATTLAVAAALVPTTPVEVTVDLETAVGVVLTADALLDLETDAELVGDMIFAADEGLALEAVAPEAVFLGAGTDLDESAAFDTSGFPAVLAGFGAAAGASLETDLAL